MDAMLWELLAEGSPDDKVEVLIKLSELEVTPLDAVEIVARIGNIASGRIRRGDIEKVRGYKNILSMKASKVLSVDPSFEEDLPDHQTARSGSRRPKISFTGKGVCIGIADWGFDFTHPNFLNEYGRSRFEAIWDQSSAYDGANPYGFGAIHYREEIDRALDTETPFSALGYHPGKSDTFHQGTHGTHVLDIAAGNGSIGDSGLAPGTDLIGVHLATDKFGDLMGLGDSARVFDAIHFLDKTAGKQAMVINLSVGSHGDSHAGLSLIEQAIDQLVSSKENRAVVQSCGNYYTAKAHATGKISEGETVALEWLISALDKTPNEIEIWYSPPDELLLNLRSPAGEYVANDLELGRSVLMDPAGMEIGRYYHRKNEPNTGLNQILIILNEQAMPGRWELGLKGDHIENGRYEAWIERDVRGSANQSRFPKYQADTRTTTGSICNGFFNICVGSHHETGQKNKISFFSSVGPTWDGRQKPDLTAPGVGVLAAKSASPYQSRSSGELTRKTGTSMAAPFVTGAIALLYEASGKPLSIQEVRKRLFEACVEPVTDDPQEKERHGFGALSLEKLFPRPQEEPVFKPIQRKKNMEKRNFDPQHLPIEALMEIYAEEFPQLAGGNLSEFFESLPREKNCSNCGEVRRGDVLVRRQYGYHIPAWYGVVEAVEGNEARLRSKGGLRRIRLSGGKIRDWEWRRIRPKYEPKSPSQDGELGEDIEINGIKITEDFIAGKVKGFLNLFKDYLDKLETEEKFILYLPFFAWKLGYIPLAYFVIHWLEGSAKSVKLPYDFFMMEDRLKEIDKSTLKEYFKSIRHFSKENLGSPPSAGDPDNIYLYNTSLGTVKKAHDEALKLIRELKDGEFGDYENFNAHISDTQIKPNYFHSADFGSQFGDFDQVGTSVGRFNMRMYWRGYVYPNNDLILVDIKDVATRFADTFSFEDNTNQLGCWGMDINKPSVSRFNINPYDPKVCLQDRHFFNLSKKAKGFGIDIGGDFLVYSDIKLHEDDFVQKTVRIRPQN